MAGATPIAALLDILRTEGVEMIFGNPGTTELPLIAALADAPDLQYVLATQELSAVAMADGYARATGRVGFVSLHVAAGVANGLIGMLNARRSRTPLVVVAGQQDRRHLIHDPMLSGDLVALATPATKHAVEVTRATDLPLVLRRAFRLAVTPPAGPVFVSIPMDVLTEDVVVDVPRRSPAAPPGAAADPATAVALLRGARRPAIVAGDGIGREGAIGELVALAETLGATVYHQPMNDGIDVPTGHRLYAGMLPPRHDAIRAALAQHDVVLVVGAHAFSPHHYTPGPAIPAGVQVVQIDSDAAEIGRTFAVDAALVGAIGPTLAALVRALDPVGPDAVDRAADLASTQRGDLDAQALALYGSAPLAPLAAMHAVAAGLPPDAVVVEEAITAGLLLRALLRQERPRSYVHTVGGGLGWGIGAAVGSRLGNPERPVVAVLGDGSALFGVQGLWSAVRYQVPVTFIVVDNGEYRTLKETLDRTRAHAGRYVGLDLAPPRLDWCAAAAFFGMDAALIGSTDELRTAVAGAPGRDTPLLLQVPVHGHVPPNSDTAS